MTIPARPKPTARPPSLLCAMLAATMLAFLPAGPAGAATATLGPSRDATIFSDANLSDGGGAFLLAGRSGERRVLRSLVGFDVAARIPAGAVVNSVSVTFAINTPRNHASTIRLHRVLADWTEGNSIGPMGGAIGAAAANGDVTWNHRIFNTTPWTSPGGDFATPASASQAVSGQSGPATFSSPALAADVQAWVDNPGANFGWILVAENESTQAVRFSSRQGTTPPTLAIDYTIGGGNTAPAITAQPVAQSVTAGATAVFTVAANGSPAPAYQWRRDGTPIAGATSATLTLTGVTTADAGSYSVVATNAAGSVTSTAATLTVTPAGAVTARLSNLSVRAAMSAGQTLIVGFSVSGGSRPLVVRGVGPTLQVFGLTGTMDDPRLELFGGETLVTQNDDWGDNPALTAAFANVGAFALRASSKDAAFLQSIDGTRSVHLKGTGGGVVLVELYDAGSGSSPRLVNVSARNHVGTGDNILIFGFVIDGAGTKNMLIRAIGPRLADFGVSGSLGDPRFEIFRAGSAAAIGSNDNWDPSLAGTFSAVGAFSLVPGSRDAALVTSLVPGAYTVQVSGVNNATGEALVEIYEAP